MAIRHDRLLLRILKDLQDVRSAVRRQTANFPLYDIANENTPAVITEYQDNYIIGNYDVLRLSSDRTVIISGMKGGVKGRKLQLFNVGDYSIILSSQNRNSDPQNRFNFRLGPAVMQPGDTLQIYYDFTTQRWIEATQFFEFDVTDGWQTATVSGSVNGLAWSPSESLIVGAFGGSGIKTSTDGLSWTTRTTPPTASGVIWEGVTWSEDLGLFVAVGRAGASFGNRVITSPDGINWTQRTSADLLTTDAWYDVTWSTDVSLFVAVGDQAAGGDKSIMTSPDGITWTLRTSPTLGRLSQVIWADDFGLFIASQGGLDSNPVIITSPDGITWTGRNTSAGDHLNGVSFSDNLDVAVSVGDDPYSSTDGTSWTLRESPTANEQQVIAWSADLGIFLAVGNSDAIWSKDGIEWNLGVNAGKSTAYSLIWIPELSRFVLGGFNYTAITP